MKSECGISVLYVIFVIPIYLFNLFGMFCHKAMISVNGIFSQLFVLPLFVSGILILPSFVLDIEGWHRIVYHFRKSMYMYV